MDEKERSVPYIVHEADMARMERTGKRLWIALILVIVLLVATNAAWVWYEAQFADEITTEIRQEAESGKNYVVGGDFNGAANDKNNENPDP